MSDYILQWFKEPEHTENSIRGFCVLQCLSPPLFFFFLGVNKVSLVMLFIHINTIVIIFQPLLCVSIQIWFSGLPIH